jgi:hypothetical protein
MERSAIALGIDRDRRQLHLAARADNPNGDLAAVGDENLLHSSTDYSTVSAEGEC